jgi:beta-lactamase class A
MGNKKGESNKKINMKMIFFSLLVVVLFFIIILIYFFYIPKKLNNYCTSNSMEFSLLNPVRQLISQENLIVNVQPLREELQKFEEDGSVSIYFEYLTTGANISINKDAEFWPASLLKVPVSMAVAKKIERGEWKWDNKLVLMPNDKDEKFGNLYKEPNGSIYTIEELVKRNMIDSDNTANFILTRNLELKDIENIYKHIGLNDFISTTGEIGAKKYSVIFRALYNASYLSEENSQKLLTYLSETEFNGYLKSSLPTDVPFSHKIGIDVDRNVYLDSGIVFVSKRPYLLTVMVNGKEEHIAQEIMKEISKQVFTYVSNYSGD